MCVYWHTRVCLKDDQSLSARSKSQRITQLTSLSFSSRTVIQEKREKLSKSSVLPTSWLTRKREKGNDASLTSESGEAIKNQILAVSIFSFICL